MMGRQINYYMDYESFLIIAQKALDCGCTIVKSVEGKIVQSDSISFVTKYENRYYFYLPKAGALEVETRLNGREFVGGFTASGNVIIEAGYSAVDDKKRKIARSRLYVISGYYDKDENWIARPECLDKVYGKLMRTAKKVAPYTELKETFISMYDKDYGQKRERMVKEYITSSCLKLREEEGYQIGISL